MPGHKKLNIWWNKGEYGTFSLQCDLYTCERYEFQGAWLILHDAYFNGERFAMVSLNSIFKVEEH